ncbi:hypothetical protein OJ252_379 [Cryptosporidium canis]|uniref:HIT-type domain-containing protein n=1 Tax=Cryptosporidium canis TaxID=195482 RepID=A0ABQ8PB16_9CRYT|nr:hypothetical protein OJ252_379 [Cryptosporidium canis]
MSKIGKSEVITSSNDKICAICLANNGKYKFKCCMRNFCSVNCFQIHSRENCNVKNDEINHSISQIQENSEYGQYIPQENCEKTEPLELTEKEKQSLDSNKRLFNLLSKNPKLVEMLKFIDSSENKIEALAAVINDSNGNDKVYNLQECI